MTDQSSRRGARRKPKAPVHRRRHVVIPSIVLVFTLGLGAIATGWGALNSSSPKPGPTPTSTQVVKPTASPTPVTPPMVVFSSWNIAKPSNTAVPRWPNRRDAIGRTINHSHSDVIAIQEANEMTVTGEGGKRLSTWQDVKALAKKGGYAAPKVEVNNCTRGCIHSGHLLFNTKTITQVKLKNGAPSAGQGKLGNFASGLRYAQNREFAWAFLESKSQSGPFLAISVHLNNETNSAGRSDRVKVGKGLQKWALARIKTAGLKDIPIVVMGDFNSYAKREPKGMAFQLRKAGFHDSYDATKNDFRLYEEAYTTSYTKGNKSGWPKKPITSAKPVRIDYVMYQGAGLRADVYAVALYLKADGTFDNRYRASDHMMVQAVIYFDKAAAYLKAKATPSPSTSIKSK